jgi:hypothetical protein
VRWFGWLRKKVHSLPLLSSGRFRVVYSGGQVMYRGESGARARHVWENTPRRDHEVVEFWDGSDCRGLK